jgi:hypothetical protein
MDFTNGELFGVKLRLIASAEDYGARSSRAGQSAIRRPSI